MPTCFPKWLCQFALPPAVSKVSVALYPWLGTVELQLLPAWSSVFWRQCAAYTDSGERILLASQNSAPACEEGTTHEGTSRGREGMFPMLVESIRGPQWRGEKTARSGFTLLKLSLPSVPFLPMVVKFNNKAYHQMNLLCYWTGFEFWF